MNSLIEDFLGKTTSAAAATISILVSYIVSFSVPSLDHLPFYLKISIPVIIGLIIYYVTQFYITFLINHYWKLRHRKMNIGGEWVGFTTYKDPINKEVINENIQAETKIFQNCLKVSIDGGRGNDVIKLWHSVASSLALEDNTVSLKLVYYVEYNVDTTMVEGSVKERYGFEQMKVIHSIHGYPVIMSGSFNHCIIENAISFYGDVLYFRRIQMIKKNKYRIDGIRHAIKDKSPALAKFVKNVKEYNPDLFEVKKWDIT